MPIAACIVDTNVLLRMTRRSDPLHRVVAKALSHLAGDGTLLHYTHQTVAEFWNVLTRPVNRNGLGLTPQEAERAVLVMEAGMALLPDGESVYREWRKVVVKHGVAGVQVHDARLAAVMYVHGVRHILTLNASDFARYDGLVALDPQTIP